MNYVSEDGFMRVMMDGDGYEPANEPEDFHTEWGKPVSEWLQYKHNRMPPSDDFIVEQTKSELKFLREKLERYELAIKLYEKVGAGIDHLRHNPYVIENYIPSTDSWGEVERFFIFKEENNGTTYRIVDKKQINYFYS